jgi:alkylhydroperoxidase family enzyme
MNEPLTEERARIAPLEPPYDAETEAVLARWMPPGSPIPPLALFRTIARHPMLRERMRPLGSGLLAHGALAPRVRELLILRTSARCGATYEWGVHVTAFAGAAGIDEATARATATLDPRIVATRSDHDALILRVCDELCDTSTLSDALFDAVRSEWGDVALLEMTAVVGFYHLIAFMLRTARIPNEPWGAPFPRDDGR